MISITPLKATEVPPSGDLYDLYRTSDGEDVAAAQGEAGAPMEGTVPGHAQHDVMGEAEGGTLPGHAQPEVTEGALPDHAQQDAMEEAEEEKLGPSGVNLGPPDIMDVAAEGVKEEETKEEFAEAEPMESEDKDTPTSLFTEEEVRKVVQSLQSLKQLLEMSKHCTVSPPT